MRPDAGVRTVALSSDRRFYPSRRNFAPRVRVVIDYLCGLIKDDPAMRDEGDVRATFHIEASNPD